MREGSILPLNLAEQHFAQAADQRGFALFVAPEGGHLRYDCFEDDGESAAVHEGHHGEWQVEVSGDAHALQVELRAAGSRPPQADEITLLLPARDARRVTTPTGQIVADQVGVQWRELRLRLR